MRLLVSIIRYLLLGVTKPRLLKDIGAEHSIGSVVL